MSSPQLENGYLRLSNELAEALIRAPLNGVQWRIVMAVARECYGRNGGQKFAHIPTHKLSIMTGLPTRSVRRELSRLISVGVLSSPSAPPHHVYGFQKDYEKWNLKGPGVADQSDPRTNWTGKADQSDRNGSPIILSGRKKNYMSQPSGSDKSVDTSPNGKTDLKPVVHRLWKFYLEKLDKNPKLLTLTPLRQNKAQKRLSECLRKTGGDLAKAEELMQMAVGALADSEFHRGVNENKKRYDSWERNLFPNQEKLEWWLERAQG